MADVLEFVRVDDALLRVAVRGEGTPLLLIMGLGGNIEMWRPLERALHEVGIQTIAYDMSGTGESPPRFVPRRMPGIARQAAHLLDELGLPTVDVLGVSFGGAVAQELALRNPNRVDHLVLAATSCGLGGVPGNPIALSLLATPARYFSPRFLRLTADLMFGVGTREGMSQDHVTARVARPPSTWGYLGHLTAGLGWTSRPWLHRLHTPTLVLSGDRDPIVPAINARILGRAIPNARVEHVAGGHLFLLQHSGRCAPLIADFLREKSPTGS